MKRLFKPLALAATIAAAAVSCVKEEPVPSRPDHKPASASSFKYTFDLATEDDVFRATLDNEGVLWEPGDMVGVFLEGIGNIGAEVNTNTSPKTVTLQNASAIPAGTRAYAYYPYNDDNTSLSALTMEIPHRQVGGGESAMPMAGIPFSVEQGGGSANNGVIYFLNLASIIDFKVYSGEYSGETVQSITFQADGTTLAGDAVMDLSAINPSDESTLAFSGWGSKQYNQVTVKQQETVASSKDLANSIYMVIAPGTYPSGTITIETDAALYTFQYTNKALARNELKHYTMNLSSSAATRQAIAVKSTLPYSEPFTSNKGAFVIEGGKGNEWTFNASYGAKVTGSNVSTSLVSPWIDLSSQEAAELSFVHYINSSLDVDAGMAAVYIMAEGDVNWTKLDVTFPERPASGYSSALNVTKDISSWVGKKIRISFAYNSIGVSSAAWEIKNFVVALPTPVYSLYSGAITEGDYLIVYNGKAMKNTISSNRFSYEEVSPSNNKIEDPDASIIWHIAPSGNYWTIYNAAVNKYAAANGTKNQGQLLASGTDDKSLWTVSGTSTYEFVNKNNSSAGVNANLRNNSTYGFATYSTGTGGALSLYKLSYGSSSSGGGEGGESGGGADIPVPTSGLHGYLGCLEMPDVSGILSGSRTEGNNSARDDIWYRYYTNNNKRQIATHTFTHPTSNKKTRTYTVLYDESKYAPVWTAHAMHSSMWPDDGVGRKGSWGSDPAISLTQQEGLDNAQSVGYSRGHFVASNYRQSSKEQNNQTFYYTNQAPQWQNSFNSGVWSAMEEDVVAHLPSGRDTLYLVIGVLYEGNIQTLPSGSLNVPIPSHFYTCMMKCSFNTSGNMTSAKGIAYLFTNEAHSGHYYDSQYVTTIRAVEERAGFNFFANVPSALQDSAEQTATPLWSN